MEHCQLSPHGVPHMLGWATPIRCGVSCGVYHYDSSVLSSVWMKFNPRVWLLNTMRESLSMAFNAASFLLTWNSVCWLNLACHDRVRLIWDKAPGLLPSAQPRWPAGPPKVPSEECWLFKNYSGNCPYGDTCKFVRPALPKASFP